MFDQTVWPTFQSYLLTVHLREGRIARAYTEPLQIENYTPRPITGPLAEHVAREAAGREPGPFVMEGGSAEVDIARNATTTRSEVDVPAGRRPRIFELSSGWAIGEGVSARHVDRGRDLLWIGSFEDADADDDDRSEGMWELGAAGEIRAGRGRLGSAGMRLSRTELDRRAAVAAPRHRLLLERGRRLSVVGYARVSQGASARVRLSLYDDTKGRSFARRVITLKPSRRWSRFRLDTTVPARTVAVGLYLKHDPAASESFADFDDLRVLEWAPGSAGASALYGHVRIAGPRRIPLHFLRLPGGPTPAKPPMRAVG